MKRTTRGRPPLDDDGESVPINLKMAASQYDAVYRRAQAQRVSVQTIIRADVRAALESQKRNTK